ncbi:maltooligosyl trehalose synthase [Alkalispirochaeta americana]|uniref:Maltooligosyl trehalose synthase n=1 Tax=Alkalispirochaeta americana TaxID=159291 RepID=A0A1N6PQD7_9SPIO|nr:malto-oligosyltrehalose synthase [Alkalispirochaeta americana]SIQ06523.1 maltooligosyl trehalose synthase [Alkalispirochaeta americana]
MSLPLPYPRATYRLQLSRDVSFAVAAELVPYLARLGISHLYTSPFLTARSGSTHGYDIVDHNSLNEEYGGEEGFALLTEALHHHNMGLIVDFVPNHMGVGFSDNAWWLDVLEWGESSPYAQFFDIDWKPSEQSLRGKVLIPILGAQYGTVLDKGELELCLDTQAGTFSVHYYQHRFPLSPRDYSIVLQALADSGRRSLQELAKGFASLADGGKSPQRMALKIRRSRELSATLARLLQENSDLAAELTEICRDWQGTRLHRLLERQAYRLAYWRMAANEINYRRFFDINDLAAIRMERPEVFEITHQLMLRFIQEGSIQGLRLDHVDGLLDPREYLSRLQKAAAYRLMAASSRQREPADRDSSISPSGPHLEGALRHPVYVVVEKILAHHEKLRKSWEVSGSTGYEHMTAVAGVLTDPAGETPLTEIYQHFTGEPRDFPSLVLQAKYRTMQETLASELNVLANRLSRLAKSSRHTRDLSRLALRTALMDIVARFPVYRSYVDASGISEQDRRDIEWAVAIARKESTQADTSAYSFIQDVLTLDILKTYPKSFRRREILELAMKVQQFTAPVMAKSFEDTAFYRDSRFVARNEVGAEPDRFYLSVQAFHYGNTDRLQSHPFGMVATATHDHKRGEDTRARLNVLSEVPGAWQSWVTRITEAAGTTPESSQEQTPAPSRHDQYLLLQTLAGTWPLDMTSPDYRGHEEYRNRITAYMRKAAREAKLHTSWTSPNENYEEALDRLIESLIAPHRSPTIMRFLEEFITSIMVPGAINSLTQKTLTLTVPGVPDIYQGTTGWDFSLVDPDNRRPVDFSSHQQILDDLSFTPRGCAAALHQWRSGAPKQLVVAALLNLRRQNPDLFALGEYLPLETSGTWAEHILAFARRWRDSALLVVCPRLTVPLTEGAELPLVPPERWHDTAVDCAPLLQEKRWITQDLCTSRERSLDKQSALCSVAALLENFPVAAISLREDLSDVTTR